MIRAEQSDTWIRGDAKGWTMELVKAEKFVSRGQHFEARCGFVAWGVIAEFDQ